MDKPIHKTTTDLLLKAQASPSADPAFSSTDLMLLTMTAIWGSNFVAIKYSLEDLLPLSFNGLRFAIASLTLSLVLRISGKDWKVQPGDGWKLFGFGLLANAIYQSLFIIGIAHTRTGNAALIVSTTPFFTAVIGRLRRQEYFTPRAAVGLVLAFAGVVLIILNGSKEVAFGQTIFGDLLLLCATLCWTLYTVGAKNLVHTYGSLKATTLMMLMATPVFLLVCAPSFLRQDWIGVRTVAWGGVAFSAFLAIALSHALWNHGVKKIGSTRTAIYSNITPVIALFAAWLVLGEKPTRGQIGGAAVIFIGLYFVRSGMIAVAPAALAAEELDEASLEACKN